MIDKKVDSGCKLYTVLEDDDDGDDDDNAWLDRYSISLVLWSFRLLLSLVDDDVDNNACNRRIDATTATEKDADDPRPAPKGRP